VAFSRSSSMRRPVAASSGSSVPGCHRLQHRRFTCTSARMKSTSSFPGRNLLGRARTPRGRRGWAGIPAPRYPARLPAHRRQRHPQPLPTCGCRRILPHRGLGPVPTQARRVGSYPGCAGSCRGGRRSTVARPAARRRRGDACVLSHQLTSTNESGAGKGAPCQRRFHSGCAGSSIEATASRFQRLPCKAAAPLTRTPVSGSNTCSSLSRIRRWIVSPLDGGRRASTRAMNILSSGTFASGPRCRLP
jgi:hypothetical protein